MVVRSPRHALSLSNEVEMAAEGICKPGEEWRGEALPGGPLVLVFKDLGTNIKSIMHVCI